MNMRILTVCLGNICRSPSAEGVIRAKADAAGKAVVIDSAGTGGWHIGEPPYGPAQKAARARGYDLSRQRARQVRQSDFHDFDLILAMDDANLADLMAMAPPDATARVVLFLDYAPDAGRRAVPDPYYTRDFDEALDLIEQAADGLIATL